MSSVSDILTSTKNIVTAINGVGQFLSAMINAYLSVQGTKCVAGFTATTLVTSGTGRVASVSVIVPGSTSGIIYDSSSTGTLTNAIAGIDNTSGVKILNIPYVNGLVVVPGTGMTVAVTYSEG